MFIAESPQRNLFKLEMVIEKDRAPGLALEGHVQVLELVTAFKFILVFRKAAVNACAPRHLFEFLI